MIMTTNLSPIYSPGLVSSDSPWTGPSFLKKPHTSVSLPYSSCTLCHSVHPRIFPCHPPTCLLTFFPYLNTSQHHFTVFDTEPVLGCVYWTNACLPRPHSFCPWALGRGEGLTAIWRYPNNFLLISHRHQPSHTNQKMQSYHMLWHWNGKTHKGKIVL